MTDSETELELVLMRTGKAHWIQVAVMENVPGLWQRHREVVNSAVSELRFAGYVPRINSMHIIYD